MNIRNHTFEAFVEKVLSFHGFAAPGVIIGGFMVDLAYRYLPENGLFNAISETSKCLPDAIQLLTPCTTGNGHMTVINLGRYALTLYDRSTGEGVRVSIDSSKLEKWPEVKSWFMKLKTKKEQDYDLLIKQIKEAGGDICNVQRVKILPRFFEKKHRGEIGNCPRCHEAYPLFDGTLCLGCQGESPYLDNGI